MRWILLRSSLLLMSALCGAALAQSPSAMATSQATAGANLSTGSGALCDPRKNVVDPLTHRFRSDCGPREWCQPNHLDPSLMSSTPSMPAGSSASTDPSTDGATATTPTQPQAMVASPSPVKQQQQSGIFNSKSKPKPDNSDDEEDGYDGSDGSDSDSGSGDSDNDSGSSDYTAEDGDDAVWRRNWETLDDWQTFRRALSADGTDTFNASDTGDATRVTLPVGVRPTDTASGLPMPTSGVCRPKGCRRDEYPFGYKGVPQDQIPPLCGPGTFCPDEEDACRPLIPLGGVCQLNRDDSCSPPGPVPMPTGVAQTGPTLNSAPVSTPSAPVASSNATGLFNPPLPSGLARRIYDTLLMRRDIGVRVATAQSSSAAAPSPSSPSSPSNSTIFPTTDSAPVPALGAAKPMCLQGVCHLADASRGHACIIDHTQYLGYDGNGQEVVDTVSRDNCRDALYCDDQTRVCLPEKAQGEACDADRECLEFNCNYKGVCDVPPEAPNRLPAWAFVLIGLAILSSLIITVYGLYRVHLAHRAARAEEIDRYFSEQWTFRQSILSMHAAALAVTGGMALGRSGSKDSGASYHDPTLGAQAGLDAHGQSMLVGSPNGSVYMSPLGARHLRILSVDRRDSDDSENTLYNQQQGLQHPLHQQQQQQSYGHSTATGIQHGLGNGGGGTPHADSASSSPFLDGRLSKRKPAPAA